MAGEGTVNDAQEAIDTAVKSVFETVLGHTSVVGTSEDMQTQRSSSVGKIVSDFEAAATSVDNLKGINTTLEEQEKIFKEQDEQLQRLKDEIIDYENKILNKKEKLDQELQVVLSDDALSFPKDV
tara:strand:- start:69 stop:443 length:375 start_codon:yes stop_codon:yes gene_type:complete